MNDRPGREGEREGRELLAWLALAAMLRFLFLSRWSFWGDEAFSLFSAQSIGVDASAPTGGARLYPVYFVLARLSLGLCSLGISAEWAMRLVPALSGTLLVGVFFAGPRGWLDRPERRLLAALALFSPWLQFQSQYARFYAPLLLVCALAAFCQLRALREGSLRSSLWAMGWLALGVLIHPTALLLLGGLLGASLVARAAGQPVRLRSWLPLGILATVLALAALLAWTLLETTLIFQLSRRHAAARPVLELTQGIVYNLGIAVSILVLLGLPGLWRRDRLLFTVVIVGAGLPGILLLGFSALGTFVEQRYLLPVLPLLLVPAATLLAGAIRSLTGRVPAGRAAVLALAFLPSLPALVSNLLDGNRHDLAGAARFLAPRLAPTDGVITETHGLLAHYLPQLATEQILEAPPLRERSRYLEMMKRCERIWVVLPSTFESGGSGLRSFYRWAWENGRMEQELYRRRLDYHQNRLQVFLVTPAEVPPWRP